MADPRWEAPALDTGKTIDEIAEVAERMAAITAMMDSIFTYMLQEGTTTEDVEGIRTILSELHADERKAAAEDGAPYPETTIRATYVASIVYREMANFLETASRAFIVDYEVEYGGTS